VRILAPE